MKILVITSLPPHIFGGAEIAAFNFVKLLVSRGHDVNVTTIHEDGTPFAWGVTMPEDYKLYHLKTVRSHTLYGRTKVKGRLQKALWHLQGYFDPRNVVEVKKLLDAVKPEHIDIHNILGIGFNALEQLNESRASITYVLHDVALACFHATLYKNGNCTKQCGLCRVSSVLRQQNVEKMERLGFISPSLANIKKLTQYAPVIAQKPSLALKNSPDDLPALPEYKSSPVPEMIFVGRLDHVKGIDFLLDALEALVAKYPFHISVFGTGPLEKELRAKYASAEWVTLHGFVRGSEVAVALAKSDLYCMPSIWTETYGMTTAQALQIGTPVIGSAIGGTLELVKDGVTGLLVEPGNKNAWQKGLSSILETFGLLQKWRENACKLAYEFDKDAIGDAYEAFIATL